MLPHDWLPWPMPANVQIGEGSYLASGGLDEDSLADFARQRGVHACHRFVEQQQRRLRHQRTADLQQLFLAARQRGGGIVDQVIEPQELCGVPGSLGQLGLFGFWSMIVFLGILTIGFIYEWKKGALEWE